jgi:hypothetical protein
MDKERGDLLFVGLFRWFAAPCYLFWGAGGAGTGFIGFLYSW